jgi:serine phosphatase RsbU (regulator of sigma subunit)
MFVTLVLAVVDPLQHTITIVNAGHPRPLLRRGTAGTGGDEVQEVTEQAGPALGLFDGAEYEQLSLPLDPGDFLMLYTDGISEAMNVAGHMYGVDRIRNALGASIGSVAQLGRHILDDVKSFVGGRAQSDDMCLVCFGRDSAAEKPGGRSTVPS